MTKRRGPEDHELWGIVTRTVRPYHPAPPVAAPGKSARKAAAAKPVPAAPATPQKPSAPRGKEMDAATARKMKRGEFRPEGTLDLHGMTQGEAFGAFSRFIARAAREGKRSLLVITGKGARGGGVLRRLLPLWAEEVPAILALSPARPKDGGEGAFYVRLRRGRD